MRRRPGRAELEDQERHGDEGERSDGFDVSVQSVTEEQVVVRISGGEGG